MNTTMMIKMDKRLRDEAKETAMALGLPLTTVMHSLLKQFVRERKITVSLDPVLKQEKVALFEKISNEMNSHKKGQKVFTDVESLLGHLDLI